MPVYVQSTIKPYNDKYKVANAKDIGVGEGENEKSLDEVLNDLPTFDLVSLGLGAISTEGVALETDTTEIMAALDNGAVKFIIAVNVGAEIQAEVVMNKISAQNEYICAYTLDFGASPLILTLIFFEGGIQGYLAEIASGGTTAQPTAIDLSGLETNGTIVETYADGTTKTTTLEFDADGNPIKITDGDGNVTTLTW